jgi:hypothetical protein
VDIEMLTQTLEKSPWLIKIGKMLRRITVKAVLNVIGYVLVLLLMSSIAVFLMYLALVAAASTPY